MTRAPGSKPALRLSLPRTQERSKPCEGLTHIGTQKNEPQLTAAPSKNSLTASAKKMLRRLPARLDPLGPRADAVVDEHQRQAAQRAGAAQPLQGLRQTSRPLVASAHAGEPWQLRRSPTDPSLLPCKVGGGGGGGGFAIIGCLCRRVEIRSGNLKLLAGVQEMAGNPPSDSWASASSNFDDGQLYHASGARLQGRAHISPKTSSDKEKKLLKAAIRKTPRDVIAPPTLGPTTRHSSGGPGPSSFMSNFSTSSWRAQRCAESLEMSAAGSRRAEIW